MEFVYEVEGGNFTKAGNASSAVKKTMKQLNVDPKIVKRTVVALYEAEVNIVAHAYGGVITVNVNAEHIHIVLDDNGPGIPDIDLAMQEGFSTASSKVREMGFGAGMGLPNIKKNVDELKVSSEVDKGTRVEMKTYLKNQ
ncbi:ATP-binding protein [Labilibacter marinus]|uniref:ATP-binding protein n=1 Tax=Labilibacter marinus TaxID=1477105 RepID=UPI00082E1160|nr:ATP-binding protein [Labilibacter marinus]